jgi:hypothetical protein
MRVTFENMVAGFAVSECWTFPRRAGIMCLVCNSPSLEENSRR